MIRFIASARTIHGVAAPPRRAFKAAAAQPPGCLATRRAPPETATLPASPRPEASRL